MKRLFFCLLAALFSQALSGTDTVISKLELSCEKGQLVFSLEISDPFQGANLEKLKSGLDVSFRLQVEIRRPRKLLPDRVLIERIYSVNSSLRPRENDYSFVLMDENMILEVQHGLSLDQVRQRMSAMSELAVSGEGRLQQQEEYVFAVRALVGRRYLLGLVPLALKTPWREARFIFRQ